MSRERHLSNMYPRGSRGKMLHLKPSNVKSDKPKNVNKRWVFNDSDSVDDTEESNPQESLGSAQNVLPQKRLRSVQPVDSESDNSSDSDGEDTGMIQKKKVRFSHTESIHITGSKTLDKKTNDSKRKMREDKFTFDKREEAKSEDVHPTEDEAYRSIREELSHMSFEELQKLKDRLGLKVYKEMMRDGARKPHLSKERTFTRKNKNRPMEMSSKRPVSVIRGNSSTQKKVIRDPRFDDLSGEYNEAIFKRSYAFLDDIKQREKEKLSKQLRKAKNEKKKQELKHQINKMRQQESAEQQRQHKKQLQKEWKKKELGHVQEGKNPFFLKKSDLRKLELAERYKDLKKSGKLEKYLEKKRKKNASKERKKLPAL